MMQEYHNKTVIENNFVDISLDEGTTKEDEEDIKDEEDKEDVEIEHRENGQQIYPDMQ